MERAESGTPEPLWDNEGIKAEIRRRGATVAQLARDNGIQRGTLQEAFRKRYPKGQLIVAQFIGRSRHELWPHWYGPDDRPPPRSIAGGSAVKSAA